MSLVHISFDIETLGSDRPTSAITQLGAVAFYDDDLELGSYFSEFEVKIGLDDSLKHGLTVDQGSIEFWMDQPDEVRRAVFKGKKVGLVSALNAFGRWIREVRGSDGFVMWSYSTFDPPILNNAYEAAGIKRPYPRTCFRDLTTKLETVWGSKANIQWGPPAKIQHHALYDSIEQGDTLKLALAHERQYHPSFRI